MNNSTEFGLRNAIVGSAVIVRHNRHDMASIVTVTKAGPTKFVLSDGSKWTRRGNKWGVGSWGTGSVQLILDRAAADAEIAEERAERRLEKSRRVLRDRCAAEARYLSAEQCGAIFRILDAAKAERGADERDGHGREAQADRVVSP